jgi:mannose-1-phosphate guanylyltransferase / mannose-6-phosphate isomerase
MVLVMPSDHVIRDVEAFHAAIERAVAAAERGLLVTFGIAPTHPHTGYGYIERGDAVDGCAGVHVIRRFVEKPAPDRAVRMVADPAHSWNGGIFLFRASSLIEEVRRHAPDVLEAVAAALEGGVAEHGCVRLDAEAFGRAPAVPIDVAVMEKTDRGAVVPAEMGWSDIGSWSALWEAAELDGEGNCVSGATLLSETRNTLVRSTDGILTAVVGVADLIVVTTADAVLVTSKARCDSVKGLVADMDRLGRQEHLTQATIYRPWGSYRSLDQGDGYLVKRIDVKPGAVLSLQYHNHRSEHWVVVAGEATVTRGAETFVLKPNEATDIPLGEVHRIENRGSGPLSIIEVQSGRMLSEDDIVRVEDRYGREDQGAAVAAPAVTVPA